MTGDADEFPMRPLPPRPEDCCNSGCARCVYDIYDEALERWERALAARTAGADAARAKPRVSDA